MEAQLNSLIDALSFSLCIYILSVGLCRMASMGWKVHKRAWIVIYFAAVASAVLYLYYIASGSPHGELAPMCGFISMALWFHESRDRWRTRAPDYMRRDFIDRRTAEHA